MACLQQLSITSVYLKKKNLYKKISHHLTKFSVIKLFQESHYFSHKKSLNYSLKLELSKVISKVFKYHLHSKQIVNCNELK